MQKLPLILMVIVLFSCKKDKLEGDKSILIGKWEWKYTVHTYNECNPPSYQEVLTPATEGKTASIEFFSKGNVLFNNTDKKRIVFAYWGNSGSTEPKRKYEFGILLNNKNDNDQVISGWVGADTLILTGDYGGEPFEDISCDGCCTYTNYFNKQ